MDSLNTVLVSGVLERAGHISWHDNGQPVASARIRLDEPLPSGVVFRTYVPIESYGTCAEKLAACTVGDVVAVEGKLRWRAPVDKTTGHKPGGLVVLARTVTVLVRALASVAQE